MSKGKLSFKIFLFVFLIGSIVIVSGRASAQNAGQTDAIAIRVIPNPGHYSPMEWYQRQGFSGSPTAMRVDGYPAIKDGRTVYVNVANVSGNNLYTNIYLISYTQEATPETSQIFDQILSHWRFNTNMTETGECMDQTDTDQVCLVDADCTGGGICDSEKAKITRDTERLGNVVYIRGAINEYKEKTGSFPILSSGTYLPGKTISTWPSWSQQFARDLGISIPVDPVNKMGDCGEGYDSTTCWDDEDKKFADRVPTNDKLDLPTGSNALVYEVTDNGQSYNMCAYMESPLVPQLEGDFGSCTKSVRGNTAPSIDCGTLLGFVNESFEGYVSARDQEGDAIDITISGLDSRFTSSLVQGENKVKITASNPAARSYSFTVRAEDVYNASESKTCTINIESEEFIIYPIVDQNFIVGRDFGFTVYANHTRRNYAGINFVFDNDGNQVSCKNTGEVQDGRFKCEVSLKIDTPVRYSAVSVYATNGAGERSTTQNFVINVYNDPPEVTEPLNCDVNLRVSNQNVTVPYSTCTVNASDPNGHAITGWAIAGQPAEMAIRNENGKGLIEGHSTATGTYSIFVRATDQYGLQGERAGFQLSVNNYCGDGKKQRPNMEGKGGPADDGYEECDVFDGAPWPDESSVSWQYGCQENCEGEDDGYCGDSITQDGKYTSFPSGVETVTLGTIPSATVRFEHADVDYREQCDDGNTIPNDGCDTQAGCYFKCGDGRVTSEYYNPRNPSVLIREDCDDGNAIDGDGCNTTSANCRWTCGDGVVTSASPYNEQCDFAGNNSCCSGCRWTTGPYTDKAVSPSSGTITAGNRMAISLPASRGVRSIILDSSPDIETNDFSGFPGMAVMMISDITGLPTAQTLDNIKNAGRVAVDEFYTFAERGVNVNMGTFGFGNCPAENYFCYRQNPLNLRGSVSNVNTIKNKISSYTQVGDLSGARSSIDLAIPEAHRVLMTQPSNYRKYMIVLSDGCACTSWDTATKAAATAAKADGIEVYTVCYWADNRGRSLLCNVSSQNGTNCVDNGPYAYNSDAQGTQMVGIVQNIITDIIASIPVSYSIRIENSSGNYAQSNALTSVSNTTGIRITIPTSVLNCDISGSNCTNPTLYVRPYYSGTGQVEITNIRANTLAPCP